MASVMSQGDLDTLEQLRRIEQLIADADARNAERAKADSERKLGVWQLCAAMLTAGAALMGAGVALASILS